MAITANITVVFDVDCESATFGKFIITDVSDYAGEGIALADVAGTITVTYPDGDSTIASIVPATSLINSTVTIPQDANGNYMEGVYTFAYSILVIGAIQPGTYVSSTSYDYCPTMQFPASGCYIPTITVLADCFCLTITATDATSYGVPTTISRTLTLYPPPSLGLPSVSTSAATLVYPFSYTGGYEIAVDTLVTYVTGNVTISGRIKGSCTEIVKCDVNLCALYNCMKKMFASLERKAGLLGGKSRLPLELQDTWDTLIELDMLFAHALQCGQYADAQVYYDRIEALVECDCGCQNGEGPQLVNPYCGASPGSGITTIVDGTGNITVTSVTVGSTVTYTVGMSSGFVQSITDIENAIIALQGDITTINNTIAALPPKQYYLLYDDATVSQTGADTLLTQLKTYTLPANTLEVGDILKIKGGFSFAKNSNNKTIGLRYGLVPNSNVFNGIDAYPQATSNLCVYEFEVHKISAPQIMFTRIAINGFNIPAVTTAQYRTVAPDSNIGATVLIEAFGQNGTASAGDITCVFLTVELIKAP